MFNLLYTIRQHKVVDGLEILEYVNEPELQFFKLKVTLSNASILFIREISTPSENKYSYHWQSPNGKLLRKRDNAPHWERIETFPHHVHVDNEETIEPSTQVTALDVLDFIFELFKRKT